MSDGTGPTSVAIVDDQRRPIGWANYPGDVLMAISREFAQPKGPNYMGELMWPIEAHYDRETKRTRVGFSLIPPPEVTP